jgi:hypothetical protein
MIAFVVYFTDNGRVSVIVFEDKFKRGWYNALASLGNRDSNDMLSWSNLENIRVSMDPASIKDTEIFHCATSTRVESAIDSNASFEEANDAFKGLAIHPDTLLKNMILPCDSRNRGMNAWLTKIGPMAFVWKSLNRSDDEIHSKGDNVHDPAQWIIPTRGWFIDRSLIIFRALWIELVHSTSNGIWI